MPKLLSLLLALIFLATGCSQAQKPATVSVVTPPPQETATPTDASLGAPVTVYYPEGVDADMAAYRVSYTLPSLENRQMAAALDAWLAELFERVESERLPLADRAEGADLPSTEVTYSLQQAQTPRGMFTNLLLYESSWFDSAAAPEQRLSTLVFDAAGTECSLASVSGVYDLEPLAAQQVWNIISQNPAAYHGDLTLADVAGALDLYNGFTVAEEGFTLYVQPGVLAPDSGAGEPLEFSFGRNALYPDFVGDQIPPAEYEALLPSFFALASYCGANYQSWQAADGLPAVDTYTHGLKLEEAHMQADSTLLLSGLLIKGLPGDTDLTEVSGVSLRLELADGCWQPAALTLR